MFPIVARTFRRLAAAGLLLAMAMPGVAQAETWKCYTYHPSPTHIIQLTLVEMMEQLGEATGGRIDFKCNVGGSLPIDANSIVSALGEGVIDFASTSFVSGTVPLAGLTSLPGLFQTQDEMKKAFEVALPTLSEEFERHGVVVLGAYLYPRQVIWSKGPINTLDDLKGKNVRVLTLEQTEFVSTFGGVPVTIGTPEVATSLQRGVISVVLTADAGGGKLWVDFLDHVTEIGPNFSVSYILASKDSFDALSAEEQDALRKIVQAGGEKITAVMAEENTAVLKEFVETKGLTITPTTPEEEQRLTDSMKAYWEKWAQERGETAVKLLAQVREAVGR